VEASPLRDAAHGIFWIGLNIGDVNGLAFQQNSPGDRPAIRLDGTILHIFIVLRRRAVTRDVKEAQAFRTANRGHIGFAQPGDRFCQRIEH
jgi:hypothetical protein